MQRQKNVQYDDDDLYDEEDDYGEEPQEEYTAEDKDNFATLTPVVRAELEEAGLSVSDSDIQESLWHYYWDVGKSVSYLKNARTPRQQQDKTGGAKKEKSKRKFDQAAEKSAEKAGNLIMPPMSAADWFRDVPWSNVPSEIQGHLEPSLPARPSPKLLGGSTKLAKLAEERRRKAASETKEAPSPASTSALSSLDRLSKPREVTKENEIPEPRPEPKKYPIRKKREPTPPPKEPTPPPPEPEEELPDLRASTAANVPNKGKQQSAGDGLEKKTEQLKLSEPAAPPQPKIKSKGLDVPKLWAADKAARKGEAAFVVIGHVDHGKSTLMGRLLLDTGAVSQRDIDRYQKQAAELGKSSFALAWVMDTGSEERERGVTVDIAQHHFSADSADFTILDAPGHRDFVPNMIGGASMADLAVLVVDANQLDSGMKGQTREHILLARAVGIKKVVVAVNKLDATAPEPWSRDTFADVSKKVQTFLSEVGYSGDDLAIVPCSGLNGENVAKPPPSSGPSAWIANNHPTLLQALEHSVPSPPTETSIHSPLRLQIADVFRGGITNPLSIAGRLRTGHCQVGDVLTVLPAGETATIRGIEVGAEPRDYAVANEVVTLHITDIDPIHLRTGDLVCSSVAKPVQVVKAFTARIQALESLLPQAVDVHLGRLHAPGGISHLMYTLDEGGQQLKRKPRMVREGQKAVVKVSLGDDGQPVEVGERVVLRCAGGTVAYGTVEETG
ncbi:elongation factor EF-1 alpha subunit [Hortaea werneckii]|nr:elongation factor EF-1 alpha subunit [Hortaea werneckii]KAI7634677.1 elongation factor EF-1 alpha subunit [Hortaea werneckii]KAI7678396.1 elongation factor EF-1 alpha subunit [Hortaea werneckii]